MTNRHAITLFGPTASGKTSLAIGLANALNGVIINADSRQVYTKIPIISAMPSAEEFAAADHRLFNFLDPENRFSAGDFAEQASKIAEDVWNEGKIPIFVGGTGFYLKTLLEGISPMPNIPPEMEAEVLQEISETSLESVYEKLKKVDPESAFRLPKTDLYRVSRAYLLYKYTNKTCSNMQNHPKKGALKAKTCKIALKLDRALLYDRIHQRFDMMIKDGVEQEIRQLYDAGYSETLPALKGLGIPEFYAYFRGKMSHERACELTCQSMRRYAKRQYTWLNNSYNGDIILETNAIKTALPLVKSFLS